MLIPAIVEEMRAVPVHGSPVRDLDLIAAPWREGCSGADALETELTLVTTRRRVERPHCRLGYVLQGPSGATVMSTSR